ncbi:MAG: hypothetical protein L3J29_05290 [Cyclobacteriaceae bacterium]|nr:hypothetical protein [Cyclobacteriaceae bacterium]
MGIDEAYIWMERDCWKERTKSEVQEQKYWTFYKPLNDVDGFYEIRDKDEKPIDKKKYYIGKNNDDLEIHLGIKMYKLSFENEDTMVWDLGEKILDRIINKN